MKKKPSILHTILSIGMAFLMLGISCSFTQVNRADNTSAHAPTLDQVLTFGEDSGYFFIGASGKMLVVNEASALEGLSTFCLPDFEEFLYSEVLRCKILVLVRKKPVFEAITFLFPFHHFW